MSQMTSDPIIHQSIRRERIACGEEYGQVASTGLCRLVTCPECLQFLERVTDAVMVNMDTDNDPAVSK